MEFQVGAGTDETDRIEINGVVLGGGTGYSTNEFAGLDFGMAADRLAAAKQEGEMQREGAAPAPLEARRMLNVDVVHLYERVEIGTEVLVT